MATVTATAASNAIAVALMIGATSGRRETAMNARAESRSKIRLLATATVRRGNAWDRAGFGPGLLPMHDKTRPQPSGWGTFSDTSALSATLHDFVSKQASSADAAQTALPQKAGTGTHDTSHVHGASAGMPAVSAGQAAFST